MKKTFEQLKWDFEGFKNNEAVKVIMTCDLDKCEKLSKPLINDAIKLFANVVSDLNNWMRYQIVGSKFNELSLSQRIAYSFCHHMNGLCNLYCASLMLKEKNVVYDGEAQKRLIWLVHDFVHCTNFIEKIFNNEYPDIIEMYDNGILFTYKAIRKENTNVVALKYAIYDKNEKYLKKTIKNNLNHLPWYIREGVYQELVSGNYDEYCLKI